MQDDGLNQREKEIAYLRDVEGLPYRAIGDYFGITMNRARQIYIRVQHIRRSNYKREFCEGHNQTPVQLHLTLGEAKLILQILDLFNMCKNQAITSGYHNWRNPLEDVEDHISINIAKKFKQIIALNPTPEIPPMDI